MSVKFHTSFEELLEVDRMINEGLGGGFIDNKEREKQLELMEERFLIKRFGDE